MFDSGTILTAGSGLVGWKSSTHENYVTISSLLKSPTSGIYVNSLPGVTVELAEKAAPEESLADYLDNVHNEELRLLVNKFVNSVKSELNSKELLSNVTLIHRPNLFDSKITKDSRFVGYLITPKQSKNIKATITDIGFEMDTTQDLTVYFFESSQKSAVTSFTYTCSTADTLQWQDVSSEGLTVEYETDDKGTGCSYLIGYFEDDLTGQVYAIDYSGEAAIVAKQIFGSYMGVSPLYLASSKLDGTNIPNRDSLTGSIGCRHPGFNLKFNVKCDITDIIVDNIQMFARPLQHAIAIRLLSDALANTGLNPVTMSGQNREQWQNLLNQYKAELHGGHAAVAGSLVRKKGMMEELTVDFSRMDAVCLKKKHLIKEGWL